jgi:uncharacterized membrane protein YfcA
MFRGTVLRSVVVTLALGSVPGSMLGVRLLQHLLAIYGDGVNDFIKSAVGILLILVAVMLLLERKMEEGVTLVVPAAKSAAGMVLIGLVAGFLVGMTSVGSGTIIMMLLLLFYRYAPKVMVGTDIVHAVVLTGVTGMLHYRLGNVDFSLVSCLLVGSIPGALVGSYLGTRLPVLWLRRILCALVLATGARMLWAPLH